MTAAFKFTIDTSDPNLSELAGFFAAQTNDAPELIFERLQWQMRNPSRRPDVPFAWCVRTARGALGGAMLCTPYRLTRGVQNCTALMSSGFYVDVSLRGAGMNIFLQFCTLSAQYVLYATTANTQAGRLWQRAGAKPLLDTDHELLRPIRWSAIAEESLVRRLGPKAAPLVRLVAPLAEIRGLTSHNDPMGALDPVSSPEDAVIPFVDEGLHPVRDADFIRWRFFEVPQTDAQIYRYCDKELSADGFVAVTRARRGYRQQIRTLFLADMWGKIPPSAVPGLLSAIGSRYRSAADVLAIRCLGHPSLREALRENCIHRDFGYATGWYIDRKELLGPDPVLIPASATELV